ncbi:MAG: SGNH/GDSL hydrolase family protein [Spartobacteria bacterium]|nr:SGNH/GDSL hydrolase family protein [Spartobacteria bacterium]
MKAWAMINTNHTTYSPAYHIVVIGSSTAEGVGPQYGWVDRVRDQLQRLNPDHKVTNLGQGGYTSYRYLPDNAPVPPGQSVDCGRNITKALSLEPDLVILNNPSNDLWIEGFHPDHLFRSYHIIFDEAAAHGVPILLTTSQPTCYDAAKRSTLIAIRNRTHAEFGDAVIDFWTGLAKPDGTPLEAFRTHDDVHLNDAAHEIFCKRVMQKIHHFFDKNEQKAYFHPLNL